LNIHITNVFVGSGLENNRLPQSGYNLVPTEISNLVIQLNKLYRNECAEYKTTRLLAAFCSIN